MDHSTDDMIITSDDFYEIVKLEKNLFAEFEMKSLGYLKFFLGVEVACSSKGMLGCKPVDTHIVEKHYLGIYPDQEPVDKGKYQRLILAYLKSAPGKGILYENSGHMRIEGFTDADWAGDVTDRCSTFGYFKFVGGNLVTWKIKKQNVVSRSSAEAEFRGFKAKEAISLYCDNKSAWKIAENPVQHDRTKHVEVDRHFIKEELEKKIVSIPCVGYG
ncbi:unnamed protein product [Malus baccata var. baccata]